MNARRNRRNAASDRSTAHARSGSSPRNGATSQRSAASQSGPRAAARRPEQSSDDTQAHRSTVRQGGMKRMGANDVRVKGRSLATKLIWTMCLVTFVGIGGLGVSLAGWTDYLLFQYTKHGGVEVAKMAAQVGRGVLKATEGLPSEQQRVQREALLVEYFEDALRWGGTDDATFIDGVYFDSQGSAAPLNGIGIGKQESDTIKHNISQVITLPGHSFNLNNADEISIAYLPSKVSKGRSLACFRVRVTLSDSGGQQVVVDYAIDSLARVRGMIFASVAGAVVLLMIISFFIAKWLATRVTHPVKQLMHDMQIVANGDLDHLARVTSKDEVGVLTHEFNTMTHNLKVAQAAMIDRERAAYEMSLAREVQEQLLPSSAPNVPNYQPATYYKGAKEVSGDYYDFIPLGNGRWGMIVADVSGKGVPGSMVMAITRTLIRLVAQKHPNSAADTLKETNRLIAKQIKRGMFVTAMYAILDPESGKVLLASAGHNPLMLYRHGRGVEEVGPKGIAIGFNEGPLFDKNIQEARFQLNPGDAFCIYTDGFPEAMNEENEELGDDTFKDAVAQFGQHGARGLVEGLVRTVLKHRGEAPQSDDLTLLVMQRTG